MITHLIYVNILHMEVDELKAQLKQLVEKTSPREVSIALQTEGLSPRSAELLSVGDHAGGFRRRTVTAVRAVLAKQGMAKVS